MHVYPGPASNVVNMQPRTQLSSAIFIPDEMRNDILSRNEIANLIEAIQNPGNPGKFAFNLFNAHQSASILNRKKKKNQKFVFFFFFFRYSE